MWNVLRSFVVLFSLALSLQVQAKYKPITAGGEIPWPLLHQYSITAESSVGLWQLDAMSDRLFNIEVIDEVNGVTFLRVSELDSETYEVLFWGEGFIEHKKPINGLTGLLSQYLNKDLEDALDVGSYLYMYPNGDINEDPHMIRLVEVRVLQRSSLGISVFPMAGAKVDNRSDSLGLRMQKPLACSLMENVVGEENLFCEEPEEKKAENKHKTCPKK